MGNSRHVEHVCGNCANAENWRIETIGKTGERFEVGDCGISWLTNIYGEQIRPFVFRGCGSKCNDFSAISLTDNALRGEGE